MTIKKKIDRVIGVDLGNGLVNVRSVYPDGSPYTITFPSAFGYKKVIGEEFGQAGTQYNVKTFTIDGVDYIWGEDIAKTPEIIHTASLLEDRYETKNYKNLIKIILGYVAKDIEIQPTEQILISTGVPSNQTKESTVNAIRKAFLGDAQDYLGLHKVAVNGEEFTINVAMVTVTPQPLATVLAVYLDENGLVKNRELKKKKIAVIDIGGGTTDLDTLFEFRRQNDYRSIGVGFRDVYKAIQAKINEENGGKEMNVNDYIILDIIEKAEREAKEKGTEPVYTYQGSEKQPVVDFTKVYQDALHELGMKINQAISNQWKDFDTFDKVFLVGGSALRVAPYIEILQEPDFPKNPGLSNVEGYYNFGVSKMNENNKDNG